MRLAFQILEIFLISLKSVSKSHVISCQPGSELKSVFEQNCGRAGWVALSDPKLASDWCEKRKVFKCVAHQDSGSSEAGVGLPKQPAVCDIVYEKECRSHDDPASCVMVPRTACGHGTGSDGLTKSVNLKSIASGRQGNNYYGNRDFDRYRDHFAVSGVPKRSKGSCRIRVMYVRQCTKREGPKCLVVPVPDTDCSVEDDHSEESDDFTHEREVDGFDEKDLKVNAELERKKKLESGTCQLVNIKKCHGNLCSIVAKRLCKDHEEADGMDRRVWQDTVSLKPPKFDFDRPRFNKPVFDKANREGSEKREKGLDHDRRSGELFDDRENPFSKDIQNSFFEDFHSEGSSGGGFHSEESLPVSSVLYSKSSGKSDVLHQDDDELTDAGDLEYLDPSIKYADGEQPIGESGCKLVESCKSVPKKVCRKAASESGDNVYCKESALEECEVSVENNNNEICHSVVDKICKPIPYLKASGDHGYETKLVCKDVDVYSCTTEHEVETVSGERSSCIQVPRVKCDSIPEHFGYKKHSKSCMQVSERICRKFSVVEPQPKVNSKCGYQKVKSCYYEGGSPVKSSELIQCTDVERSLCGTRQTKELVPDICSTDYYPHCQYAEGEGTENCHNIMLKDCQKIEKC